MAELSNGWVVVDANKEQNQTVLTTKVMNLEENKKADPQQVLQQAEEVKAPLQADPKLIPLAKEKQLKKRVFDKTAFRRNVGQLNARSREADKRRLGEKNSLKVDVSVIRRIQIKGADGRMQGLPADIKNMLKLANEYIETNATAREYSYGLWWNILVYVNLVSTRSRIKNEHKNLAKLMEQLGILIEKYSKQPEYDRVVRKMMKLESKLILKAGGVAGRRSRISREARLKAKWNHFDPKSRKINGLNKKIETTADSTSTDREKVTLRDRRDWPLFAHKPSIEDIVQGRSGNCFFLAALAAIPSDKIREMMLDHGDGTVTVRFYEREAVTKQRKPVYVTVDKTVNIASSLDCLWVQIMEKAYALFRQDRAGNKMSFTERKVKQPGTGRMIVAPQKEIAEDVIDLGYLSNGGQSHAVLGDLLGTEEERIYVYRPSLVKTTSKICMEALQMNDEKGAAVLQLTKLMNQLQIRTNMLEVALAGKGIAIGDVRDTKQEIQNIKDAIKVMREEQEEARQRQDQARVDYVEERIHLKEQDIAEAEENIRPIRSLLYEFWDEEERLNKEIAKIRTDYDLPADREFIGSKGERFNIIDGRRGQVVKEIYGYDEELQQSIGEIEEFQKQIGETDIQVIKAFADSGKDALIDSIEPFLEAMEQSMGRAFRDKTKSASDYEKFLRTCIKSAKEKDAAFQTVLENTALIPSVNDDRGVAENLLSRFLEKILLKMIPKLGKVEGIGMEQEYGVEDEVSRDYYDRLKKMLDEGQSVCVGTRSQDAEDGRGFAGEGMAGGMVGGHAYTVLSVTETEDGVKMVQLRNPWGDYVSDYKENRYGKLESYSVKGVDTNGVFWMELNHFLQHAGSIYGSGVPDPT